MLAVAAATTLVACGNKEAQTEEAPVCDSTECVEEVVEAVVDSADAAVDTVVAVVEEVAE